MSPEQQGEIISRMPKDTRRAAIRQLPAESQHYARMCTNSIVRQRIAEKNGGQAPPRKKPVAQTASRGITAQPQHGSSEWGMPETVVMGVLMTLLVLVCCGFYFLQLEEMQSTQTTQLTQTALTQQSLQEGEKVTRSLAPGTQF